MGNAIDFLVLYVVLKLLHQCYCVYIALRHMYIEANVKSRWYYMLRSVSKAACYDYYYHHYCYKKTPPTKSGPFCRKGIFDIKIVIICSINYLYSNPLYTISLELYKYMFHSFHLYFSRVCVFSLTSSVHSIVATATQAGFLYPDILC